MPLRYLHCATESGKGRGVRPCSDWGVASLDEGAFLQMAKKDDRNSAPAFQLGARATRARSASPQA